MVNKRLLGILHLSIAHHPLCWHYRNHLIRIKGIGFCLGCTGFYSGLVLGIMILFFSEIEKFGWSYLILIAMVLFVPTILRLVDLPLFNTNRKDLRLIYRILLGFGVAIGFISIFKAPNIIIGTSQFIIGMGLYLSIGLRRVLSKDSWKECEECGYSPSPYCPGFIPFNMKKSLNNLENNSE